MSARRPRRGKLYKATLHAVSDWKERFHSAPDEVKLGRAELRQLLEIGEETHDGDAADRLDAWLILLDEIIVYFVYRIVFLVHFLPEGAEEKHRSLAITMLASGIATDLLAIRSCVENGPVEAAYAISRQTIERVDVLCLLIEKPELVAGFIDQDPEAATKFWKRSIAGGRARKARIEFLKRRLGEEHAEQTARKTAADFGAYSMAVHPSAPMGMAYLFAPTSKPDQLYWPAFLRPNADAAIRPTVAAIEYGLEAVLALKYAEEEGWTFLTPNDQADYVHQRVKGLELLMLALFAQYWRMRQDTNYSPKIDG